ncbi:MAG: TAXI family TRAP transporter solute-binding subunit [Candidatus Tectomicrobia bacterium]|nr:TAXI family TRAP transporter solute-binding subunit [Candidatus Tectomicrobia bacterium]
MGRKLFTVLAALSLLWGVSIAAGSGSAAERVFLKIGSSSLGGSWFPTMSLTASVINYKVPGVVSTVTTGGAITNVQNIESGTIDMGLSYTGTVAEAWDGKGPFKKPHRNIRAIGGYFQSAFSIAVLARSPIRTFYDIKGKRTTAGKKGWGSTLAYARMLEAHGLSFDKVREAGGKVSHVGWGDAVLLMKDRQVDVIQLAQPIPNPLIMELEASFPVRVLGIEKPILEKIVNRYKGYVAVKVPKGMYKGQDADAWTIADNDLLVAGARMPEDLAYKITQAIYENPALFEKLAWLKGMTWKRAAEGVEIPFHRGAARYFKEKGLSVRSE